MLATPPTDGLPSTMGMTSPTIAGQPLVSSRHCTLSTSASPPSRQHSIASSLTHAESGLNKRTLRSQVGCQPTPFIKRKKLPWLDGGQQSKPGQVPGGFESKDSLEPADVKQGDLAQTPGVETVAIPTLSSAPHPPPPGQDPPAPPVRPSVTSLDLDPAMRAVGSEPDMSRRHRPSDFRRLSLNSEPRSGLQHATFKRQVQRTLDVLDERGKNSGDSPSEYSTTLSSDPEPVISGLSQKDPARYERMVAYAAHRKHSSYDPNNVAKMWLQSQLDLRLDTGETASRHRSPSSCRSCDLHNTVSNQPSPRTQQMTRRTVEVSQEASNTLGERPPSRHPTDVYDEVRARQGLPSERQPSIQRLSRSGLTLPPQALSRRSIPMPLQPSMPSARKPTLFELPPHLMGSSSSSGPDIASHLQTSTSTTSPESSPQAMLEAPDPPVDPKMLRRQSRSLNRAVTGLENLMEEALTVAKDAAQNGRPNDVAHVLNNATAALRKASTVHDRMAGPLVVSPHESGASSNSDSEDSVSNTSPLHSRGPSAETAPTLFTRSAQSSQQPILVEKYRKDGRTPISEQVLLDHASSGEDSISRTPPRLYQPPSADSFVRDFAYARESAARPEAAQALHISSYGAAADCYSDHGESVATQPGVRRSFPPANKTLPDLPPSAHKPSKNRVSRTNIATQEALARHSRFTRSNLRELEQAPTTTVPTKSCSIEKEHEARPKQRKRDNYHPHVSDFFESSYYRYPRQENPEGQRKPSTVTDTRPHAPSTINEKARTDSKHPRKHISLKEGQGFSLGRYHRRQPIAREWHTTRKRITATIACLNTVFIGLIAGIYAGEVPKIQYQIADLSHKVILGNVLLFVGLGLTTLIFWPLPLLHGRKPYTLLAFGLMLPLQFPQALAVSAYRDPSNPLYRCGLLVPRILTGMAMGFANINQLPTLLDLFGASLMSEQPHQEVVSYDDVRRQGGGVGIWLGVWSWCFVGSLSLGFCIGACIISSLDPSWGFYIVVMLLAVFLLINVITPETRRAPYRRSISHFFDEDDKVRRRLARGEVMLHLSNDGPKWWFQEVWSGVILTKRMLFQPGYFILMSYVAWVYAEVTLVILFLGALLSRDYQWRPQYIGAAALSLAIGAFFAIPLAKASLFSRSRYAPPRTDSMTMRAPRVTWTSHLMRRCIFTLLLPFAGLAYTLTSPGPSVSWAAPVVFCGLIGFLSNLAIAECVGLIMETFDTCDLQPGVNQKHRLQSMAETTRRRRTNYSSFPRVCSGFFCAQSLGFFLAAAATGVSGDITRALGAQEATAVVAALLLFVTVALMTALGRWKEVQVIPNSALGGTRKGSIQWGPGADDPDWKPVIIGNPSGKMRRVNLLEMGSLSRWTEIRKLNKMMRN